MPQGIDGSQFQAVIDWAAVKESGKVDFAYARASYGASYTDPDFARNHDIAKERGIPFGAYHFWRFDADASAQANLFLSLTEKAGRLGTLLPMVDVEEGSFTGVPQVADVIAAVRAFIAPVEAVLGKKMLLYTNYDTWQRYLANSHAFAANPLWLAQTENPDYGLYGGWPSWTLWQDSTMTVPGITGPVDRDILNGPLALIAR